MNARRIWILVGAVVAVGVLVLGWVLGVSPLLTQADAADAERATVDQVNAVELAKLAQMKEQYEGIDDLRIDLAKLRVSLPAEADTDFVYALLNSVQGTTGAAVESITTGQAVPYGSGGEELPPAEPTTDSAEAGSAPATVPSLYTVPVTITFQGVTADQVLSFVSLMQTGPRLFLVTSVSGDGAGSSTIVAYMFVLYDENAPRGGAAQAYSGVLPTPKASGKGVVEPTPEPSAEPDETATPTPTPTP